MGRASEGGGGVFGKEGEGRGGKEGMLGSSCEGEV